MTSLSDLGLLSSAFVLGGFILAAAALLAGKFPPDDK